MRSTKDQLVKKRRSYACETISCGTFRMSKSPCLFQFFLAVRFSSGLHEIPRCGQRTARNSRYGIQPKATQSSRAGAMKLKLKLVN
ncbi:hypothetical protein TNCV_1811141 [Trichonephila clavipes]|nr:hypothetical protein TNCV_1811141 [Trichonephila clavipes]